MISLVLESKIKDYIRRNWRIYGMGAGALAAGIAAGEVADRTFKGEDHIGKDAATGARTAGALGAGWAMKKKYDQANRPNKTIKEVIGFKEKKAADVIEKTGGDRAVGHLRKHWKKYAGLAGAGVALSIGAEGERIGSHQAIRDALKRGDADTARKYSDRLRRAEVVDNLATGTTVGAGAAAGAGKLFDRRKEKRA